MAAPSPNSKRNSGTEVTLILDPEKNIYLGDAPLYQSSEDPDTFYLDEALTVKVNLYTTVPKPEETVCVLDHDPLSKSELFNKERTLFLIDLMRQQLEASGQSLLQAIKVQNPQMKPCKGRKKHMWREMATRLSKHFQQVFHPDQVARKWYALEDEYKKVKDDDRATKQDAVSFPYFSEMEEVLGGHHDIEFPVVGTAAGVEVRRPKALTMNGAGDSRSAAHNDTATTLKRKRTDAHYSALLDFLKESVAARQQRHEETLAQMKSAQDGFEALMHRFLDKL